MDDLLTINGIAKLAGVKPGSAKRWVYDPRVPFPEPDVVQPVGVGKHSRYWKTSTVREWLLVTRRIDAAGAPTIRKGRWS